MSTVRAGIAVPWPQSGKGPRTGIPSIPTERRTLIFAQVSGTTARTCSRLAFCGLLTLAGPGVADVDKSKPTSPTAEKQPPEDEDLIRCGACDERGRSTCARCDGKKKLQTECPRCDGSGLRPCTVCNHPDDVNDAEPGSILCSYCDGSGVFGAGGRKCPKCGGPGVYKCPTCRGRGELKCKKVLYAGICPTCRFTGKTICRHCAGKKWVPRPDPSSSTSTDAAGRTGADTASPVAEKSDGKPTAEQLEQRFAILTELRLTESNVDTATLRRTADDLLKKAKKFGRELETLRSSGAGVQGEIVALRRRFEDLETRSRRHRGYLGEIETLAIDFDSRYSRCQKRLASRPPGPYKTGAQKRRLASWVENMAQSIEACERHAVKLEAASPSSAAEATSALEAELQRILGEKKKVGELVATAQELTVARAGKNGPDGANGSSKKAAVAVLGDGSANPSPTSANAKPSAGNDAKPSAENDAEPSAENDAEPSGSSPLLYGLISALGGFGLATVVFFAVGRRRKRLGEN